MNQYKEHLDKFSDEHIHHIVVAKETVYGLSKRYETTEEDLYHLEAMVAKDDLGKIIGKNGRTLWYVGSGNACSNPLLTICLTKVLKCCRMGCMYTI